MKSQSQIMMVALTISFVMALSLAVALVCISHLREDPLDGKGTDEVTLPDEPSPSETTAPPTSSVETTDEGELSDPSYGLRYLSNGDGTCKLMSVGSCTDACVVIPEYTPGGERVVEIAEKAFFGCSTVTAVQIPSSVRLIGELAFADCGNLVYISVSAQNRFYCDVDGILYTADERTLILYPPMRAGNEVAVRAITSEISPMAFYNCAYLTHVNYMGSAAQWDSIRIGSKNYSLTAAAKTFLSGNGT